MYSWVIMKQLRTMIMKLDLDVLTRLLKKPYKVNFRSINKFVNYNPAYTGYGLDFKPNNLMTKFTFIIFRGLNFRPLGHKL